MRRYCLLLFFTFSVCQVSAQFVYDTLSREEKIFGLSKFWREATYNFVYFDKAVINWDSAYYAYLPKAIAAPNLFEYWKMLAGFAALLKDGHTSVFHPDYFYREKGPVPVSFVNFKGRRFVSRIDERLVQRIPLGTEMIAVNGLDPDSFYRLNPYEPLKGTPFTYTFLDKTGKSFDHTIYSIAGKDLSVKYVPAAAPWTDFESRPLEKGIYYVKLNTFSDKAITAKFDSLLPAILQSKALIIDIRANGGGNSDYARYIAEYLTDKKYIVEPAWKTRVHRAANKAWASLGPTFNMKEDYVIENKDYLDNNVWEKHAGDTIPIRTTISRIRVPVLILTSRRTFSAAEDFLIFLDGSRHIQFMGQPTAGSSGQPYFFELVKGLTARICAKRDSYPDGREYIGTGIMPHILIEKNAADYLSGKDTELQAALQYLKKKL